MYITWWNKPVDIEVPTIIKLKKEEVLELINGTTEPDPTNALNPGPNNGSNPQDQYPEREHANLTSRAGLGKLMLYGLRGRNNSDHWERITRAYGRLRRGWKSIWKQGVILSLVELVYGGVHVTPWNNVFPSHAEELLWQIAAAITAIACSMFALSLWLIAGPRRFYAYVFALCTIPRVLARLYLLVESFASLRRLPANLMRFPSGQTCGRMPRDVKMGIDRPSYGLVG